ncbi:hypothetical protein IVB22_03670 [Bradyrhizobium sp. 190]|uniref:hypothetical protein n=1 Tax=Bradyrhizobium sp. 190 TaxID=2782658 RepID=UPI001FF98E60|nr:hypothetical protein [Bradyrhizobium sp. 190]MCK1511684.1 hypothetical protein [Bradyrhizobium sp. 190]
MTAARNSRSSGNWWTVYGGPLLLGVLSIAGLLTALLSEGAGRYFSWIAVGAPVAATAWFFARRKRG